MAHREGFDDSLRSLVESASTLSHAVLASLTRAEVKMARREGLDDSLRSLVESSSADPLTTRLRSAEIENQWHAGRDSQASFAR